MAIVAAVMSEEKPTREERLAAFAARLNELLDDEGVPKKAQARHTFIASICDVGEKGARKWLVGESFPQIDTAIDLAERFNASFEWLMTGRGAKYLKPSKGLRLFTQVVENMPRTQQKQVILFAGFLLDQSGQKQLQRELERLARTLD